MSANLTLEFDQIKTLINQCDINEKIELAKILDRETFSSRFKTILKSIRNINITDEEILNEVETIRNERNPS